MAGSINIGILHVGSIAFENGSWFEHNNREDMDRIKRLQIRMAFSIRIYSAVYGSDDLAAQLARVLLPAALRRVKPAFSSAQPGL